MEIWRFLKWLYGEVSGDLGVYEHCVCMGECCAHSPCLSISSDYFILVERNPMDKCQRDRWKETGMQGGYQRQFYLLPNFI